uniref:Xylulose kinase-1 n=1 Tax=Tanacetum cinerariifolium TaxID=118510 RepID=A0A6L2NZB3_TANCI|nr:hypothetical protein [Tanacetum cinerariifolium]
MVAILEKGEHNIDFHPIVDFVEASPLRYALTYKPTVYVSHIRQFWSTARIETTEEGTKILTTVDGILRTVTDSSLRRNLKLQDEEGISSLPDAELFKNLTLMGYNIFPNQKFTFQNDEPASLLRDVSQATVLASGVAEVPTVSGSIPTVGPPAAEVPTGSDVVPTAGPIFATATVVTPYTRRKGKETMVEYETPKKNKIQEQMDIQMAR